MKKVEVLKEELSKRLPGVAVTLDSPKDPSGSYWLDGRFQGNAVVVEWRPSMGFGVSSVPSEGYGEGPDEFYDDWSSALERIIRVLRDGERTHPPDEIVLRRLRESRRISQEELAALLGVRQATVSKMERQADMNVSTLRKLIEALGGTLELNVRFPEHTVRIALGQPGDSS
jgi:DNA-binding XRE family transcriptional regulator